MSFLHVRGCGGCGAPPGVGPACRVCRLFVARAPAPGVGVFSRYVSGDGAHTDAFSPSRSTKCPIELMSETTENSVFTLRASLSRASEIVYAAVGSAPGNVDF